MKKDTTHIIQRAEHFKTILTAEGFLVGIIAGLVVLLYRVLLEYAGKAMTEVLQYAREYPAAAAAWLFLLVVMACIVGKLVKWEPMISGSGIPQVEGEMMGKLEQVWWLWTEERQRKNICSPAAPAPDWQRLFTRLWPELCFLWKKYTKTFRFLFWSQ